ncbi:MAG: hypothetical protein C5B52_00370 [Bacteroidetes bacterium]|nr:MAG: hypothetical protein C5B52_00370 [Bacteroidota bacterium]
MTQFYTFTEVAIKKIISIFCLLLYGLSGIGATFQLHYCGGRLSDVSILAKPPKKDCCGKPIMPKKCCKTKKIELNKNTDQEKISSSPNAAFKFDSRQEFYPQNLSINISNLFVITTCNSINAPPGILPKTPCYLLYRSILI